MVNFKEDEALKTLNHSCAHLMAQAIKHLYPQAKFWVGPVVAEGFYYDVDLGDDVIRDEDIPVIEKEMKKIAKTGKKIIRKEISKEEAQELFKEDEYKLDLIADLEDGTISCYEQGDFTDLCRGPHVDNVKLCRNFKLLRHSGAYWKGDSNNKVLQRIYGVCFPTPEELEDHLRLLEEAKERDHRKIGKDMNLFMVDDLVGRGLPMFLPKGYTIWQELENYIKAKERKLGYLHVMTPCVGTVNLYKTSGHWDHYKENMYTTVIDDTDFAIKPMNCPGGMLVYKLEPHSYRDLPLRMAELGLVHRHELSGALHGLFRVRCFTQDDAHIFMTWDQMKDEIENVVRLFDEVYSVFGLSYQIEVSTMPEDHIGDVKDWDFATETLEAAIKEMGKDYVINEGDGAFYGPKLDFHLADSLGRTWQCGTIQLDMQLPERFELEYTGADNEKHRPVMIHRVVLGSVERFIGVITEHFAGAFPLWLSPVQVSVIPISNAFNDYAQEVRDRLDAAGIRVEADLRNETMKLKIREAQLQKTPYMLVVGEREQNENAASVRNRKGENLGAMSVDEVIAKLRREIDDKVRD